MATTRAMADSDDMMVIADTENKAPELSGKDQGSSMISTGTGASIRRER